MTAIRLDEAIKKAVEADNADAAGHLVDMMRFNYGYNNEQAFEAFNKHTGITRAAFDNLMYMADEGY